MNTVWTILFFVLAIALVTFIVLKIRAKKEKESRMKWIVPLDLLDSILPEAERRMIDAGFGRGDYVLNVKDCSEFAPEWKKVIGKLLAPHRPSGKTEWMKQYSFRRDNGEPHRVVAIKTDAGMRFIDTYSGIASNDYLYRPLSDAERENGRYFG